MVVQKAGVSRGILYHYFKDKEELFEFLLYLAVEKSMRDLDDWMDWEEDDLIRRICEISKYRLAIVQDYPYLIEFSDKYSKEIAKRTNMDQSQRWREKFYHQGIDFSKFKDQAAIEEAVHMIRWTYKGIYLDMMKRNQGRLKDDQMAKVIEDFEGYYQIFVALFY
jgi:AcrR family transcriptional regulator